MKKNYKYIFFDLDDTLLDFTNAEIYCFSKTLQHYQLFHLRDPLFKEYKQLSHKFWNKVETTPFPRVTNRYLRWKNLLDIYGFDINPVEMCDVYLDNIAEQIRPYEDTIEVCKQLKQKYQLGIITNGFNELQNKKITNTKLTPYFSQILTSEQANFAKPSTKIFQKAITLADIEKEDCLMVGDRLKADIKGGNNYGIDTCWINRNQRANFENIYPTFEIDSLSNLLDIL